MTEDSELPQNDKQPNPTPPPRPVMEAPSMLFYAVLMVFAVILIWVAFVLGEPDWPSLFINLASGIIGAVIILIFVDRQLRVNELQILQQYADTTSVRIISIFSNDIRSAAQYAKVFHRQLYTIQRDYYISIPAAEAIPIQYPDGFFLLGLPGSGKSTLLQRIAIESAKKVIHQPKDARIPIFLPARDLLEGNIVEVAWRDMGSYYSVKRRIFDKWLSTGRLKILIDGIDENRNPRYLLYEIVSFKRNFPKNIIITSSRDLMLSALPDELKNIGLPIANMPSLSKEEAEKLITSRFNELKL